jgi:hypothetical protein
MATTIPGITDDLGNQDLYTPDYSFLIKAASQKQNEYDRGFNAFKTLANSALNSALTNTENISKRQEIFKKIQESLRSVSGLDLSNQANIAQAMNILTPITHDKELLYDMSVTKMNQEAAAQIDTVKNSFDSKTRDMYNEYSEMDIQQQTQKLKNAKRGDGSILQVAPGEFVPYENPAEFLEKQAKDSGMDIEITKAMGNGYLETVKNGKMAIDPFTNWAKGMIGNKYDRYFNQVGKVQSEQAITTAMNQNKISRTEAAQLAATHMTKNLINQASLAGQQSDQKIKEYDLKLAVFEEVAAKNNGKIANIDEYNKLKALRENYVTTLAKSKTDLHTLTTQGAEYVIKNMGSLMSDQLKQGTASDWATRYAIKTTKIELKPDEVVMKRLTLAQSESQFRRTHDLAERNFKYKMYNDEQNRNIAMLKLGADGKAPATEYIGQVDGTALPAVTALQTGMEQTRTDLYNHAFGAGNGLLTMVYSNSSMFNKMSGTINKLRAIDENTGGKVSWSKQDQENLGVLFADLNTKNHPMKPMNLNINSRPSVNLFLKNLVTGVYNKAKDHINDHIKSGKNGTPDAFANVYNNVQTLINKEQQVESAYEKASDIITSSPGQVHAMFTGARIVGQTANHKPIYDFSGMSEDAKTFLNNSVGGQFNEGMITSSQYNYTGLSESVKLNILRSKTDNPDLAKKLLNVSDKSFADAFNDDALVTYNPVNKTVTFTLKPVIQSPSAKKLGVDNAAASYNFVMTYDEAAALGTSNIIKQNLSANTLANRTLGITSELAVNPNKTILSPSYMEQFGYKYELHPTKDNQGQYGVNISIQKKDHSTDKWKTTASYFQPLDPSNRGQLNQLESNISSDFTSYINVINNYNSSILNSKDTLPIDFNK